MSAAACQNPHVSFTREMRPPASKRSFLQLDLPNDPASDTNGTACRMFELRKEIRRISPTHFANRPYPAKFYLAIVGNSQYSYSLEEICEEGVRSRNEIGESCAIRRTRQVLF